MQEIQHLEGILLPEHQTSLRVGLKRDLSSHSITHSKIILQDIPNEVRWGYNALVLLQLQLQLRDLPDGTTRIKKMFNQLTYLESELILLLGCFFIF